jgi:conjugal transfer mating pair stabilization protein TraN
MLIQTLAIAPANAGSRFVETSPCSNAVKTCVGGSGTRTIEGFQVSLDCWEWGYVKTCNYPSKNDCRLYERCYAVGDLGCLLQDSLGYCVNLQREFSCKSWDVVNKDNQVARMGFEEKPGKDGLICKGIPCIDGNCVDKGYETNGEMMDSLSKLYATSNMNPDKDGNFNLFQGIGQHCAKKPVGYSNCCQIDGKGWGKNLGAKCTKDEQTLIDMRSKKLCVYVGKQSTKKMNVTTAIKHRFCCFGNLLDKVIQIGGRKQLGRSFGSGTKPDCGGLSLEEILRIDWNQVDFAEFIDDLKIKFAGSYKTPNAGELASTVEVSMDSIRKYDDDPSNQANNMSGWNGNVRDDSSEADEERRLEAERQERERLAQLERERLEQARLAQLEKDRLEQERLAAIERERLAALEMERVRVVAGRELLAKKRIELIAAEKEYQRRVEYWNREGNYLYKYHGLGAEWTKVANQGYVVRDLKYEVQVLENSWGR